MSRVELYAQVHKALRYASSRVVIELGACAGDPGAIDRALRATRELLVLQEIHQRVEDDFVIPAIEARRPGAATRLVAEHAEHADCIAELRGRLAVVELDPTRAALHALYLEVTRFVAEAYLHMHDEETLAAPLLDEIYSQPELASLGQRARDSLTLTEQDAFTGALLPAMSHADRATLGW